MHPREPQTHEISQLDAAEVARRLARLDELERLMSERSDELAWANERLVSELYERSEAEAEALALASLDAVTGLPNRTAFEARLQSLFAEASAHDQPAALMFIGVERLVQIRDSFGYQVGDEVVRAVAERLRHAVRGSDLVARVGDDTFGLALTQLRVREDAAVVARKLQQVFDQPFQVGEQSMQLTAAMGIALFPEDGSTPDILLARADSAMRRAREPRTGGLQFFHPQMAEQLALHLSLEEQLRAAVTQGQFVNHYQPRFDLKTGACVGAETLVRWLHPERGLVYPAEFLDVAVNTGLIVPIGAQVLRQACMDAMHWKGDGSISVNLSAREFQGSSLIDTVRDALETSGLPARRLHIEVTEPSLRAMAGEDSAQPGDNNAVATLATLREMGVHVALDDFGAGAASLSTLVGYDVDSLKIDRQFVALLPDDQRAATLVGAVLHLAKRLNIKVVAEGIEFEEQRECLRRMGCEFGQGYALARPESAEKVAAVMRKKAKKQAVRKTVAPTKRKAKVTATAKITANVTATAKTKTPAGKSRRKVVAKK